MQMWEGEAGEAEEVSTLCTWHTHRAVLNIWNTGWERQGTWRWCWMGHRGTRRSQYINSGPWFNQLLKGKWDLGIWDQGGRDQTTCKSKSEVQPPLKNMRVYTFGLMKKKEAFSGFCESTKKNAFREAYLEERFFFFLISARQGVTITEICESGWKFWRKHLSTCR